MPTASAEAASSALTFSGPSASGVDHRDEPGREHPQDLRRRGRQRPPDEPELGNVRRLQPDLVAGERDGVRPDRGAQLLVDGGEAVAHDVERLRRRHAPPADELHLEPAPLHLLRDLRAGAVHDADRVAGGAKARDRVGRSPRRRAANLEDDEAHER